jgi:hypothetical protein
MFLSIIMVILRSPQPEKVIAGMECGHARRGRRGLVSIPSMVRASGRAARRRAPWSSAATEALLERFARHGVRATFLLLGDVARRHPALSAPDRGRRPTRSRGHGMTHRPLWALDRESFRAELRAFRAALRDATGADAAIGFRAPTFSLDRRTAWALEVLHEEGFRYDSSVFPARSSLYGVPGAPLRHLSPDARDLARHDPAGPIVEFRWRWLHSGRCACRRAGRLLTCARCRGARCARCCSTESRARAPFALYLHPWECVASLPRACASARRRRSSPISISIRFRASSSDCSGATRFVPMRRGAPRRAAISRPRAADGGGPRVGTPMKKISDRARAHGRWSRSPGGAPGRAHRLERAQTWTRTPRTS